MLGPMSFDADWLPVNERDLGLNGKGKVLFLRKVEPLPWTVEVEGSSTRGSAPNSEEGKKDVDEGSDNEIRFLGRPAAAARPGSSFRGTSIRSLVTLLLLSLGPKIGSHCSILPPCDGTSGKAIATLDAVGGVSGTCSSRVCGRGSGPNWYDRIGRA